MRRNPPDGAGEGFFHAGGALKLSVESYIRRPADDDLIAGLRNGEFCYLLDSRQIGKSSLVARAADALREEGYLVAVLDLQNIGVNVSVEQWYNGLLDDLSEQIARQLSDAFDLEDALAAFRRDHREIGPLRRWMEAVRQVILPRLRAPLILFVDEIDLVESLPFSTDEFFAGIRGCYNRRAEDAAFDRLVFCLVGATAPSDLIRDPQTTPFNIGRRIELTDFTETEASTLAKGLPGGEREGRRLLRRVLCWTGGHPYLTQRLCEAVSMAGNVTRSSGVDRLCEEQLLSKRAREDDKNLLDVRDRLLRSTADSEERRAGLLDLYGRVRRGRRVTDDETNPLVTLLRLSGIIRVVNGRLRVRNRIYERVFDPAWVAARMPDAELRRQRAAYRRGVVRAASIAVVVLALVGGLAVSQVVLRRAADEQRKIAERLVYVADVGEAYRSWKEGEIARSEAFLDAHLPAPGRPDLRDFAWRFVRALNRRSEAIAAFSPHATKINGLAFSPDGTRLYSADGNGGVVVTDPRTRRVIRSFPEERKWFHWSYSPTSIAPRAGRAAVYDAPRNGMPGRVVVRDLSTSRRIKTWPMPAGWSRHALSPDGRFIARFLDGPVEILDIATGCVRRFAAARHPGSGYEGFAFSPDGTVFAGILLDGDIYIGDLTTGRIRRLPERASNDNMAVAFSPDGRILATGGFNATVTLRETATGRRIGRMKGHRNAVLKLAFSPDGRRVASVSADFTVRLWDVARRVQTALFRNPVASPASVAFTPDGRRLAIGDVRGRIEIRSVIPVEECRTVRAHHHWGVMAVTRDGRTLATGDTDFWSPGRPGTVKLWNMESGGSSEPVLLERAPVGIRSLAFSPDKRFLAVGWANGVVRLWDVTARRPIRSFPRSRVSLGGLVFIDGRRLAIARDRRIEIRETGTGRLIRELAIPPAFKSYSCLTGSSNGRYLAQCGLDEKGVRLWDFQSSASACTVLGRSGVVMSAAFSPDARILASGDYWLGTVDLWDLKTRRRIATLRGSGGGIWNLVFSPDGRTLAACHGTMVNLWDVESRRLELTLVDERSSLGSINALFTPDGRILVTADDDGTVRFRSAPVSEKIDRSYSPLLPPLEEPIAARRTDAFPAAGIVPKEAGLSGRIYAITEGKPGNIQLGDPGPSAMGRLLGETVDPSIDFDWGWEAPVADAPFGGFRVRWTGYLRAPTTGRYALEVESNDGARLAIDGRRVLDDWNVGQGLRNGVRLDLEKGWHRLDLDYFQTIDVSVIRLRWVMPGDRWSRIVPPECLGH